MRIAIYVAALLAALVLLSPGLIGAQPAQPVKAPPSIAVPTVNPAIVKVVDVGESWVKIWGYCPHPADRFYVGIAPADGSGNGRYVKIGFDNKVQLGTHQFGCLSPDTEYRLVVFAVIDGKQSSLGSVSFRTLPMVH